MNNMADLEQRLATIESDVRYLRTVVEAMVGAMQTAQQQGGMAGMMARMMPFGQALNTVPQPG